MDLNTDFTPRPRSWMFVPGNRQRFLDKSEVSGADGILLDLEDGVLPDDKPAARAMVAATLARNWKGPARFVRVNAPSTAWLEDDLEAVVRAGLEGICLTKVNSPHEIERTSGLLARLEKARGLMPGSIRIIAAIESARGLLNAPAIAGSDPRIAGLIFGAEDFALDLGLGAKRQKEASELIYARSAIVIAATAAGVDSIDGVFPDLDNQEGLVADTEQARRLGFTAKSTFNPRQIELINTIFSPQPDEIAYAQRVVEGFREAEARGDASVAVGGQLVDRPILLRAIRLIESINAREGSGL